MTLSQARRLFLKCIVEISQIKTWWIWISGVKIIHSLTCVHFSTPDLTRCHFLRNYVVDEKIFEEQLFILMIWITFLQICFGICRLIQQTTRLKMFLLNTTEDRLEIGWQAQSTACHPDMSRHLLHRFVSKKYFKFIKTTEIANFRVNLTFLCLCAKIKGSWNFFEISGSESF
jgi:hypothetical protein